MGDRGGSTIKGGTRYRHTSRSGGSQDQRERKDEGWESRQGGPQHHDQGEHSHRDPRPPEPDRGGKLGGTNTQGGLGGIAEASRASEERLLVEETEPLDLEADVPEGAGTDQPPRMGGPLGPDPRHPHLPEGAQNSDTRGTGAGGFDRGVDAKVIGEVHQGARPEDPSRASEPGEPGAVTGD
jgi:hypothetical protein